MGADVKAERFADAFRGDVFTHGATAGFKLHRVDGERIDGTFVERVERLVRVEGPLGEHEQYTSVEFSSVQFSIDVPRRIVELRDPPRSLRTFMSRLAKHAGVEPALAEFHVPVWRWWQELTHHADAAEISRVGFDAVSVMPSVGASIELTGSIPRSLVDLRGKEYGVERMTLVGGTIRTASGSFRLLLGARASARCTDEIDGKHLAMLRESMLSARAPRDQTN